MKTVMQKYVICIKLIIFLNNFLINILIIGEIFYLLVIIIYTDKVLKEYQWIKKETL